MRTPSLDDRARAVGSLTPVALNVLLALVDRDRHGLGIAEDIESFTAGRMTLGPGTLYGALKRLLDLGLVDEPAGSPKGDGDDPRRRYYRLTPLGRRVAEIEARQLADVLGVAKVRRVL
jgi:DNA-binding PadR family transcriptional regulator